MDVAVDHFDVANDLICRGAAVPVAVAYYLANKVGRHSLNVGHAAGYLHDILDLLCHFGDFVGLAGNLDDFILDAGDGLHVLNSCTRRHHRHDVAGHGLDLVLDRDEDGGSFGVGLRLPLGFLRLFGGPLGGISVTLRDDGSGICGFKKSAGHLGGRLGRCGRNG